MKNNKCVLGTIAALLLGIGSADADPIILTAPCVDAVALTCTTGIDNLDVMGMTYNVDFQNESYYSVFAAADPHFTGDRVGADAAAIAIAVALNETTEIYGAAGQGSVGIFGGSHIVVPYKINNLPSVTAGCAIVSGGTHAWSLAGCTHHAENPPSTFFLYVSYAVFQKVNSDTDGDGVLDDDDNCPDDANPGQEDQDNDSIGDACDDDTDGDGVNNDVDNCPIDPNAGQEDFDDDTIGDACDDDIDGDTVANDDDFCPDNTVIPEGVPTMGYLNPNHWALTDGDGDFDTVTKGKGPNRSYTIEDTAGCSCEQIIEIQGLGDAHSKRGCSISAMDDWVDFVNP